MKHIAILLTVHNRKEKTLKCLKHLVNQLPIKGYQTEIYITDDGCTDGTIEAITSIYSNLKIIKGTGFLFWNWGMNLAWNEAAKSNADYYLWINDDTYLFENSLCFLLDAANKLDNKSIVVGTTKSCGDNLITYGGRNLNGKLIIPNNHLQECDHFNGNIVLVPCYVFEKVGVLDSHFHHALGDFDYGLRAKKLGIKSFITDNIMGICEAHDNFSKWCQPETPLMNRIQLLYKSTCDCNPKQYFIFEKRHFGVLMALFHLFTIHLRLFFPRLWKLKPY
jgi:GT2 family glycosyltransferase